MRPRESWAKGPLGGIMADGENHSGNSSDKKTILQAIKKVKEGLDLSDDAYFVADSAIYSQKKLDHLSERRRRKKGKRIQMGNNSFAQVQTPRLLVILALPT